MASRPNPFNLMSHVAVLLTICIRYGIAPKYFMQGLLVPILKKSNIDPSIPKNYRPVVISNTFAKLFEVHELHELVWYL